MSLCIPEYNSLEIHKMMLADSIRSTSYYKAIHQQVKNDMVVIDLGSGTGVLALASAKAGAKKTYAIERSKIAAVSKKIIKDNGFDGSIDVLNEDSRHIDIPEKADLLVSEWMGIHVFQKNMLYDLIDVRDKYLKESGQLIPNKVSLFIAPLKTASINEREIAVW